MKASTGDKHAIEQYFLQQEEPAKGCLLSLRHLVLHFADGVTEVWRYGMPFYCYHGNRFCYLWTHRKRRAPYIGLVDGNKMQHIALLQEKRTRMKILLIDPDKDIPVKTVRAVLKEAIALCQQRSKARLQR